jgi:hypothetical protein
MRIYEKARIPPVVIVLSLINLCSTIGNEFSYGVS